MVHPWRLSWSAHARTESSEPKRKSTNDASKHTAAGACTWEPKQLHIPLQKLEPEQIAAGTGMQKGVKLSGWERICVLHGPVASARHVPALENMLL